jgi:hypothetical protein
MKLGRNKPCHCGSNVKYKKCCSDTDNQKSQNELLFIKKVKDKSHLVDLENKINNGECSIEQYLSEDELSPYTFPHKNEDFKLCQKIDYIKRFKTLPNDLKDELKIVLQHIPIMDSSCYYNSLYLSLYIDGVEKVDGYYGHKFNTHQYGSIKKYKDLGDGCFECGYDKIPEGLVLSEEIFQSGGGDEDTRFIYDENNSLIWNKHSWNKYGDIHFDITRGTINWGLNHLYNDYNWREYCELPKSLPKPNKDLKSRLKSMCDIESWLGGCKNWVLNRGVLSEWMFERVGGGEPYKSKHKIEFDEHQIKKHQLNFLNIGGV